jgi:peptidyl-prolyl cis-trans isomerase C
MFKRKKLKAGLIYAKMEPSMKKMVIFTIAVFSCSALSLGACSRKPTTDDRVLARVSSKVITVNDFNSKIARMPGYYRNFVEKNKKKYLDDLIVEKLFYEEAVRRGIDRDKETKEVIDDAKKKIIIAGLIKTEVDNKAVVTKDEMRKFYEAHKDEFKTPAMWRASHILVNDEKEANQILDELAKGASFEDLARARSTDATASRGGEKACMNLNVGQTSGIVRIQFGYHIIKLTDKREAGIQSFEEAAPAIENELKRRKRSELFNNLVLSLKDKYGVEIKEDIFESLEKPGEGTPKKDK